MVANRNKNRIRPPSGFTAIELVVAAVVLMSVMTIATTLCYRVNRIWQEVAHNRIAMGELSNQLESLTRMAPDEVRLAIDSLQPSPYCSRVLYRAVLEGELAEDEGLGTRVVLRLNWERRIPGVPVELAGWLASDQPVPGREGGE